MIATTGLEVRAGSSLLLENAGLRVGKGDRIGLVGRNGAGKTTLTRILAQESQPAAGVVQVSGTVGYLPQDPRSGNPDEIARDRVLSARGLHDVVRRMHEASQGMGTDDEAERERLIARYARAEAEFESLGGYAVESQAAAIAASVGLPERVLANWPESSSGVPMSCCSTSPPTIWMRIRSAGCANSSARTRAASSSSATTRSSCRTPSTRSGTWTPTVARSMCTRWAGPRI